jgi:endonuclease YncB( thermonuclease family)
VIDGDTIICQCDLGWCVQIQTAVRVDGINAPEKNTSEGKAAKAFAETLLHQGDSVTIVSKKLLGQTEKFGRVLADIIFKEDIDFAQEMIKSGHAKLWDGQGQKPI